MNPWVVPDGQGNMLKSPEKLRKTHINVSLLHDNFAYIHILDTKTAVHQYVYPIVRKWQKCSYTW